MKWFLILWAAPIALIGAWYGLSYHDINFGYYMLSRDVHDLTLQIYAHVLGMEPEAIPPLVAKAIVVDTAIVLAIIAFRRRRAIRSWYAARSEGRSGDRARGYRSGEEPESRESLSRTP